MRITSLSHFLPALALAAAGSTAGPLQLEQKPAAAVSRQPKDYDAPYFEGAKRSALNTGMNGGSRTWALHELVMRDAGQAPAVIAKVLKDENAEVRREAGELLAIYGDRRGLDEMVRCIENPSCERPHQEARILGLVAKPEYAPVLSGKVKSILQRALADGRWRGTTEDRALLLYSTIGLARMGRPEDHELVIESARNRPFGDSGFLEALGYVDDPRSRDLLWDAYKTSLKDPKCDQQGLGVEALIPLSRLGDPLAIQKIKDILSGVQTPTCPDQNGWPRLPPDRSAAFGQLRPRDAKNFAETVFEIAAQDPEGAGTREAWEALGIMHPQGFGQKVLKLAVSRRPHWKYVSRDLLNKVVIAVDPDLNEAFWSYFVVETVPAMNGYKALVRQGLGRLLFTGSWWWTSD